MDEIETIYQSQFFLLSQLCFARYEIARLKNASHTEAYEVASKTVESYLIAVEQHGTPAGERLTDSVMRLFDLLLSDVRQSGQMN